MIKIPPQNSLRILPQDGRDFSLGAVFPQIKLEDVPKEDFVVATPLNIKDQGETDECSVYALTSVSEDQEGVELLPEFQFFKTKEIAGNPDDWGADLRDACKSAVIYGSLPLDGFKMLKGITRSAILRKESWPEHAGEVAKFHKKETFWSVTGKYDVFDNIRVALWQHRANKCSILTGAMFRNEWIESQNGIIPKQYGDNGFGHAFKIFGQKNIDGELYLMAQLSQGAYVGDGGIFYFPRSVVNKEIGPYGIYMFKDIKREDAEYFLENKVSVKSSWLKQFWSIIISFFRG